MQRWLTLVLGAAVIILAAVLVFKGFTPPKPLAHPDAKEGGAGDAGPEGGLALAPSYGGGDLGALPDGGFLLSELSSPESRAADAGIYGRMPDGTQIPPLPANAPKTVRFGVVLIGYLGAQPGPIGDRPNPRTKQDAKDLAEKLAGEAQNDFHSAVQRGDPGSQDDVGRMRVGFLEPVTDYILFTLPVGGVSQAFDTPRGYWIVKRLE